MSTAAVSESLGTIAHLDFEPAPDDQACEYLVSGLTECGRPAAWRVIFSFKCPHDGESTLVCAEHRDPAEAAMRKLPVWLCTSCDVPLLSWRWERP